MTGACMSRLSMSPSADSVTEKRSVLGQPHRTPQDSEFVSSDARKHGERRLQRGRGRSMLSVHWPGRSGRRARVLCRVHGRGSSSVWCPVAVVVPGPPAWIGGPIRAVLDHLDFHPFSALHLPAFLGILWVVCILNKLLLFFFIQNGLSTWLFDCFLFWLLLFLQLRIPTSTEIDDITVAHPILTNKENCNLWVYWFPRGVVTNYHRLGGLTPCKFTLLWFWKPEGWNQGVGRVPLKRGWGSYLSSTAYLKRMTR